MVALNTWFFHDTIKLYTGVFGSIFNDVKIKRGNASILVPIAFSLKQKYDVRNTENPDPNVLRKKVILPRMGYRLVGLRRDTTRIQNKMHRITDHTDRSALTSATIQYNRVPYVFSYELNVKTKNIEDMNQILEQILPFFNPSMNVTVEDNKDLDSNTSINVKLLDIGKDDLFEGSFEDEQVIESTLSFELEGYLYMPTTPIKIIKKVNINYHDLGLEGEPIFDTDVIQ
jgi:hypothetical protein